MAGFEEYLQEEGFKSETIYQHRKYASYFLAWLADTNIALEQVSYSEILDFTDHLKKDNSISHVNRIMLAIRYYFNWLQYEKALSFGEGLGGAYNPAAGISLKGNIRTIPHDLLSKEELEALYESYAVKDERTHRNKVMIGLLVYQALTREELQTLRPENLKLREGKISIPATGKQNGRILNLQPFQIIDLQEYLLIIRPKILAERMDERSGRKPDKYQAIADIQRLFVSMNSCEDIKSTLLHLNYALRKLSPKYKHARQIRQSVITEWLKEKDLRTVQYMAGHRYVSSTERYQSNNLEDLKEALDKYHPLW